MCRDCSGSAPRLGRRGFLRAAALGAGLALTVGFPARPRAAAAQTGGMVPRSAWGGDLPSVGPLEQEQTGDVRFLLVHHTASTNAYGPEEVVEQLRGFYRYHTTSKGWPDVAYNFFVDRYGQVYEARWGSADAPVKGDATGGSQGFALLCCFVGDHTSEPPTQAAQDAMVGLLASLAQRYGIDPAPGATTTFVSRGSGRWPAGAEVTTETISGHRDMSETACPGDAAYALVRDVLPARVAAAGASSPAPVQAAPTTAPPDAIEPAAVEPAAPAEPATTGPVGTETSQPAAPATASAPSPAAMPTTPSPAIAAPPPTPGRRPAATPAAAARPSAPTSGATGVVAPTPGAPSATVRVVAATIAGLTGGGVAAAGLASRQRQRERSDEERWSSPPPER